MAGWRLYRSHGRELILQQLKTPPPTSWSFRLDSYSATPLAVERNIEWESDCLSSMATGVHTTQTHLSDTLDSVIRGFDESLSGSCTIPLRQPCSVKAPAGLHAPSERGTRFGVWNQTSWRVDSDGAIVARQGDTQTPVHFVERQCQVADPAVVQCLKQLRKQKV